MHISKATYPIFLLLAVPKIHTNLLWDLTLLFLVLGVIYFISVFFFKEKISKKNLKTRGKRSELAPVISNFLFHSTEDPKQEQKEYVELKIEIREYLNNRAFRKIISQILFDLQKDVAGGTRERLFRLYTELELHHDAYKKLGSWRWETVSQGILELSQMEVAESYQLIRKFINDRRGVVRKQAELATVGLCDEGIAFLLDTTRHRISEWQQMKLIETLGKRKDYVPPQFNGWLLSQNKDVVLFALRLIKHYNQKGAETSINELVKHKDDEIKAAAVQCIVDFSFKSALPIFKNRFWQSSNRIKISILNAMASLGNEDDLAFLNKVASTAKSFDVISKAQSTINAIAPETILPTKDIIKDKKQPELFDDPSASPGMSIEIEQENDVADTPSIESIEVEDIEFFEEIEVPEKENKEKDISPDSTSSSDPSFELKSIEEEYGNSMDHLLGLVSSDKTDEDIDGLIGTYQNMSASEKTNKIEELGQRKGEEELPLLEHIAENEADSEMRFHAFKALKSIQDCDRGKDDLKNEREPSDDTLPLARQSVFYDLYHYTSETDARLILLRELMDIGDTRDIPFLDSLLWENEASIVKLAKKAIAHLGQKGEVDSATISIEEFEIQGNGTEISENGTSDEEIQAVGEDHRIPMELFMLYEQLGIASTDERAEPFPFDFELSYEFFLNVDKASRTANEQ